MMTYSEICDSFVVPGTPKAFATFMDGIASEITTHINNKKLATKHCC